MTQEQPMTFGELRETCNEILEKTGSCNSEDPVPCAVILRIIESLVSSEGRDKPPCDPYLCSNC